MKLLGILIHHFLLQQLHQVRYYVQRSNSTYGKHEIVIFH